MDPEDSAEAVSLSHGSVGTAGLRLATHLVLPMLLLAFTFVGFWLFQHHASRAVADASVLSIVRSVLGHPELFPLANTARVDAGTRQRNLRVHLQEVWRRQGARAAEVLLQPRYDSQTLEADGIHLVTVFPEDLPDYWSPTLPTGEQQRMANKVAEKWRQTLQAQLDTAAAMHSPEYYRFAFLITVSLLILSAAGQRGLGYLGMKYLQSPLWFVKGLLWIMTGSVILCIFPDLQWIGGELTHKLVVPMWLLVLLVLAGVVLSALSERILVAYFRAFSQASGAVGGDRQELRLKTAAHAANMVVKLALTFLGILVYLSLLGVNLTATLTSLGALGVAIGLLAQDFVKNAAAGISILLDDRYGMGDWVLVEGINGKLKVEAFTIFSTRVRDDDQAGVSSLPNSRMLTARNLSKLWSQVDYRVDVGYSADLNRALKILADEGQGMCQDPTVSPVGPANLKGVETLGTNGITLRLQLRTLPGAQWEVRRELNRRVKLRFDQEGIEMPFPQLSLSLQEETLQALKGETGEARANDPC